MIVDSAGELLIYKFKHIAGIAGVTHGVASRAGGLSSGVYRGLNISFGTGDDSALVTANRLALYRALGAEASQVIVARQIHSDLVLSPSLNGGEIHPAGWRSMAQDADGLITDTPGLFLQMSFGDCTPLLFFDPVHRAIGIAHAGWKGTVNKIAARTVEALQREFGSVPCDILTGIGPAIGPCCYQVREDVAGPARQAFGPSDGVLAMQADGSAHFNLWEANRRALVEAGVLLEHIEIAEVCTRCHRDLFFSHRGGDRGRFAALIGLDTAREGC